MNFSKMMMAAALGVCAAAGVQAVPGVAVNGYVPIDGFFTAELSDKWQAEDGYVPAVITMKERVYGVALIDTNDREAAKNELRKELKKYYNDADANVILMELEAKIDAAVNNRQNLNMSENEVLDGENTELINSMSDFLAYKGIKVPKGELEYKNDPAKENEYFKNATVADSYDLINFLQVPVKRNTLEIIAPVESRAKLMYNEFLPVSLGEQYEISGRLFSSMNPSEAEVRKMAGMPNTLDVATQIMEKKLGGFVVYFYDADKELIAEQVKYFVTADFQRNRVNWSFNIPKIMGRRPCYIKVGITVSPANPEDAMDAPIEFSDVRLQYTSAPKDVAAGM